MSTTLLTALPSITLAAIQNIIGATGSGLDRIGNLSPSLLSSLGLTLGNSAGQVNQAYPHTLAITSGTPYTINLSTGTDQAGNTIGMVHVAMVLVVNLSTTTGQDFTIGGGTDPVLGTDQLTCKAAAITPGSPNVATFLDQQTGYSVVASTSDTLKIVVAAGTAVPGAIIVLGRNA